MLFCLKNSRICAKYIVDGVLGCRRQFRNTAHTAIKSPANVTPFDIIIKPDEKPLKAEANSMRETRLSEREMLY
jgi:hypothetical protein